jgi:hypothetical protein
VLGSHWKRVVDAIGPLGTPIFVLIVLGIGGFMLVRALRRGRAA